jgi:ABC-type sugar transport system substrate-binding protein
MKKSLMMCYLALTFLCVMLTSCGKSDSGVLKIAMIPQFKGENYFDAVKTGAEEAIAELNKDGTKVEFLYDGPPQDQATNQKQVNILEGWIAQKVNVLIVCPNDPDAIIPTLKKAMDRGIKVITYDTDCPPEGRELFVNQAMSDDLGAGLVKAAAESLRVKGYGPGKPANLAIILTTKTDTTTMGWGDSVLKAIARPEYNWIVVKNQDTDLYYPGWDETVVQSQCGTVIGRMGPAADQIQVAIALSSMSAPALGSQYEAAALKPDPSKICLTGLATPNALNSYIKNPQNPLDAGVLWNCMDFGYLSVFTAYRLAKGEITGSSTSVSAERMGTKEIIDGMVLLGPALIFDKDNVDQYNY